MGDCNIKLVRTNQKHLNNQINSQKLRVRSPAAAPPALRTTPTAAHLLDAAGADADAGGKPKPKKRAASGIMKPKPISPELREFVGGAEELPRTEALKIIWAHIKGNNLQDPANKKIIVCDDKLKKIFGGRDRVGFLEISGLLNPHFQK